MNNNKEMKRQSSTKCATDQRDKYKAKRHFKEVVNDAGFNDDYYIAQATSHSSLSIEETNKIRAKLGLKPLDINSGTSDTTSSTSNLVKCKDDWGEFYHKPADSWTDNVQQEKLRTRLKVHKEKRDLEKKMCKIQLLSYSDDDDDDDEDGHNETAQNWIEKSRRLDARKKEAEQTEKRLQEADKQFGLDNIIKDGTRKRKAQYTSNDLRGLRVEHDLDNLAYEKDIVLTLKDSDVLETNDKVDVLVNVNIVDDEKSEENVEHKKRKIIYNPYENDEYDEYGNVKNRSLLSQYDNINKSTFNIGDNTISYSQHIKQTQVDLKLHSIPPHIQLKPISDYYSVDEMEKFKKPKRKMQKLRGTNEQEINNKNKIAQYECDDRKMEFDEHDDVLEKALHKARTMKQKQHVYERITSSIKHEGEKSFDLDKSANSTIVLNSTAEFCRTLGDIPTYGKSGNRNDGDDNDEVIEVIKADIPTVDIDNYDEEQTGWKFVEPSIKKDNSKMNNTDIDKQTELGVNLSSVVQDVKILDEEPDVSQGLGAALKLAMSKGYLDKEQLKNSSNTRLAHLQAQHYSIEDKSYNDDLEKSSGGGGGGSGGSSRRERYSGPIMDFKEKDDFKPNVKLEYIDDDGHLLTSKEAFRYLSHKFHGKGPGKNKIEKRIKKNVQEQLMKKMSSTDTPLGTLNMLQSKQKETQSPFVVLSGGSSKQPQSTIISKVKQR